MRRQPFTILLHIALVIILAGAIVTHFFGIQGKITLHTDAEPISFFEKESGPGTGEFPFSIKLDKVEIDYYPATTTPMDFRSLLTIEGQTIPVSMNKVGEFNGWRFYQSGIGSESSTLSVSRDPWGIAITYTGYLLLGIGMIGFFFQSNTAWRGMLWKYRKSLPTIILLSIFLCCNAQANADSPLPVMQRPLASNFGKVLVYWNDRIAPIQTMARDITVSLYGKETYKGYTPEQVLSGWLFYYDRWQRDYMQNHPEMEDIPAYPVSKREKKLTEQKALITWIGTGEIFRIYPYKTVNGDIEWLSLTGRKPSGMSLEQWTFMQTAMPKLKELLLKGKNIQANEEISTLIEKQREFALDTPLPSYAKVEAERYYNRFACPAYGGIIAVCIGLLALILPLRNARYTNIIKPVTSGGGWMLLIYLTTSMGALWWISGHVPLSNGPETMMFMALVSLIGVVLCRNLTLKGSLLIVAAMALFVAAMGGRTPRIGAMMPVLASPLLSVHVMVVMVAYALFFLMAILAIIALVVKDKPSSGRLTLLNRIILTPAVCLLGAGIFIGAVWANQTWGRYWGWDPKETCALVMWLIYALPVHWADRRLSLFRKERVFNLYILFAILSVIFTYFGANYLLSGLHSYA